MDDSTANGEAFKIEVIKEVQIPLYGFDSTVRAYLLEVQLPSDHPKGKAGEPSTRIVFFRHDSKYPNVEPIFFLMAPAMELRGIRTNKPDLKVLSPTATQERPTLDIVYAIADYYEKPHGSFTTRRYMPAHAQTENRVPLRREGIAPAADPKTLLMRAES